MSLNTPAGVCFLNASQQSLLCSTWTQEASTQEYVSSTCVIISQTSSKPSCNTSTRQLDGGSSRNLEEGTVTVEMSVTMTSTNPTVDETDLATVSSSVLQSFTADVPTALESAGLPTSFSTLPEDVEAADESGGSTAANESGGSTGGDPHFQTFNGNYFSYHGQCDLVLVDNPGFASGLGLLLHIRTTRVEKKKIKYSYISGVALKVGKDVLEVFADGSFLVNGSSGDIHETKELSGYTLVQKLQGTKKNIFVYDLNLGSKNHHIQIRANTKTGMLFVDVSGSFPGSVGLLGSTEKKGLMARDNTTDLRGYWNAFGEQWQVLSSEPKLFQENRAPQHPNGCVYNSEAMTSSLRRRLIDNSSDGVTLEVATEACSTITGPKKSFCVEDVIATGSVELAEDPFYND